ncbi:MAG: DUF4214 domain-containing protein, partial [Methanobacterium sp.]|nr:DUF4214 domain-containing protein [Methanobacterium sp.]
IGAGAGLVPGDIVAGETLTSADFAAPASEGLLSAGGASGFLASGAGTAVGALGSLGGGALAGMMLGNMVGTGAGGAAAGMAGGAATGMAIGSVVPGIGTAIGAVVGAVAGALSGFFSGLAPKADNSNTWTGITDGQGSIINETQSHGGNKTATDAMAKAFNMTLNSVAQSLGAKLEYNGVVENFGYTAKYKKYSSSEGQFDSAQDAVNHALAAQLIDPTIWKGLSDNVVKAMDASKGQSLDQITKNLDFANNFDAAIKAMKSGVTDFSKSAESAALTLGTTLTTQIENFKSQASALGLDTQAAADATKNAVEVFLGLKNTQPISDLEKSVETLYGKLQGVQGLISDVGISQTDATASVKAQIEQMLGITAASPPVSALDTQIASLKQTFANLSPILTSLGVSSDDVAKALQKQIDAAKAAAAVTDQAAIWTAQGNQSLVQLQSILSSLSAGTLGSSVGTAQLTGVLGGMTPDQIGQAVSQFGDATKVGAGAADSFLSLADSVLASKAAAERNAEAVSKATGDLNFFTNAAKSLSNYASGLTVSSASPLSPYDQYQAAKAKFESDQALAKTGDQNAIGSLQTDAQAFLTASKAYNASNQQYAADFREVQQGISSAASYAQAQAALEQKIIDTLNVPILDQLKAIEAAIQIQAAKNGSTGSFGGVGGSGIGGAPGGMNIGVASAIVTADYWSILGRAPDQGGLAGYAADIAGGSFTPQQIADAMRSSPEYLATHSHAKGGVASGWSLVGEQGPEWAYFGQPAQIFPHGTGGPSAGNDNSAAAEIRELRAQVDRLIQLIAAGTLRQIDAIGEQSTHLRQIASASSRSAANPLGRRA